LSFAHNLNLRCTPARGGDSSQVLARTYFRQLMTALESCHATGVYHRDLKV
jgi:serine/threonine protein kinase